MGIISGNTQGLLLALNSGNRPGSALGATWDARNLTGSGVCKVEAPYMPFLVLLLEKRAKKKGCGPVSKLGKREETVLAGGGRKREVMSKEVTSVRET